MSFKIFCEGKEITGVVEGRPPARGQVLEIGGEGFEVTAAGQVYERGGDRPQPFLTVFVKPTAATQARRDEQRRGEVLAEQVERTRRELRIEEFHVPPLQPAGQGDPTAIAEISKEQREFRRWLESGPVLSPGAEDLAGRSAGKMTSEHVRRELLLDDVSGGSAGSNGEKTRRELAL
ncbi:MAG TPA: hypothetical protein VGR35_11730 [Tepidisphaeraceae bacterium]|nr:hypothetical protein [Tepidisphaeraceae bacterium]